MPSGSISDGVKNTNKREQNKMKFCIAEREYFRQSQTLSTNMRMAATDRHMNARECHRQGIECQQRIGEQLTLARQKLYRLGGLQCADYSRYYPQGAACFLDGRR